MLQSSAGGVLRIGTRGSPLALAQAAEVRARLIAAHELAPEAIEVRVIRTSGDRIQDRPLYEAGGKGLFTKEIEEALLAREIDVAVHSAKDLPSFLPPGLTIAAWLPREDVRDAFVSRVAETIAGLRHGAVVGTASPRRAAQVKRVRPDLSVVSFRGNVETRLRKLEAGQADGTLLALAGLKRLARADVATSILSTDEFLPAVGQGAIAVESREDDARTRELVDALNHAPTAFALAAERAFLAALDGSCRTPIAGLATLEGTRLRFRGLVIRPDGGDARECVREGEPGEAAALGADAGEELRRRAPADFFSLT